MPHCPVAGVGAVVGALVLLAMGDLVLLGDLVATGALLLLGALLDFEAVIVKLRAMLLLLIAAALYPTPTAHTPRRIMPVPVRMILLRLLMLPAWLEERSSASWPKGSSISRPSSFEVEVFVARISTSGALKSLALKVMMIGRRVGGFIVMISV